MNLVLHPSGIRSEMISRMVNATKTRIAVPTPSLPILVTSLSNLIYKGVC